ncbi:MAG TPA: SNF2-related protein [Ktedonobacterales bacterium]
MDTPKTLRALLSPAPDLPLRRVTIPFDLSAFAPLSQSSALHDSQSRGGPHLDSPPLVPPGAWYAMSLRALELRLAGASDDLIAPQILADRLQAHPYQLRVVQRVLREKAPAAILADEVGLGKTIEAGLVLKELIMRDIVRSALIVAPKALLPQWQEELRERFDEDFVLSEEKRFRGFHHEDHVICSFQQLVSAFERVREREWGCLIVDEAHLLANPDARRRRCVSELRARWRLLLTATPVQNKITDLYSLIDLAAPGRLGTLRQFVAQFAADPATCRVVVPSKVEELRAAANEVMCRTRRDETEIQFAPRRVETYLVHASPREAALIDDITQYLRALYRVGIAQWTSSRGATARARDRRHAAPANADGTATGTAHASARGRPPSERHGAVNRSALIREIVALQQSLSSSPQAIGVALRARAERHPDERAPLLDLARRCDGIIGSKERLLLDALRQLGSEPALIFTLRLETASRLRDVIRAANRSAECYTGELNAEARQDLVRRFNRGQLQTLIATDAGAEGLNLQERCHVVFNYDLHWNPMKMEQRIGRVHRLGQSREVLVANFALRDSIDEYVLTLLYQKINLFTLTIGALETVLADVQDGELDVEERILDVLLGSDTSEDLRAAMDALGEEMGVAQRHQSESASLTVEVLG